MRNFAIYFIWIFVMACSNSNEKVNNNEGCESIIGTYIISGHDGYILKLSQDLTFEFKHTNDIRVRGHYKGDYEIKNGVLFLKPNMEYIYDSYDIVDSIYNNLFLTCSFIIKSQMYVIKWANRTYLVSTMKDSNCKHFGEISYEIIDFCNSYNHKDKNIIDYDYRSFFCKKDSMLQANEYNYSNQKDKPIVPEKWKKYLLDSQVVSTIISKQKEFWVINKGKSNGLFPGMILKNDHWFVIIESYKDSAFIKEMYLNDTFSKDLIGVELKATD